ncbi:hypothetical protein J2S98_004038 [Arthrobacter oryzae]|uniref:Uncharacterized protein n=1 Tax=Pseudarthrobacter enclensis TaxID=993070 RepID=A0ABT9RXR5_9MICC|nr:MULTISPECIES: hypothetical protein [Micrococcaceae]MDP9890043.1 hypothetical protein [Pseudarthrobacter enclensis]MDP9988849.1 hypothetical protein [Arthrobacter oryzae]
MQSPDLTHISAITYRPAADTAPAGSDTAAEAHLAHAAAAYPPAAAGPADLTWASETTRDVLDS